MRMRWVPEGTPGIHPEPCLPADLAARTLTLVEPWLD